VILPTFDMVMITSAPLVTPEALDLARPLLESLALTASEIRDRVATKGKAASGGGFSTYTGRDKRGAKRFAASGALWRSLRVHLKTPTQAEARFVGKRRAKGRGGVTSNAKLAKLLQADERVDLLGVDAGELADLETLMAAGLTAQVAQAIGFESAKFKADRKAKTLQRKARKALKDMAGRG